MAVEQGIPAPSGEIDKKVSKIRVHITPKEAVAAAVCGGTIGAAIALPEVPPLAVLAMIGTYIGGIGALNVNNRVKRERNKV